MAEFPDAVYKAHRITLYRPYCALNHMVATIFGSKHYVVTGCLCK